MLTRNNKLVAERLAENAKPMNVSSRCISGVYIVK
jgi:hypothetical protein